MNCAIFLSPSEDKILLDSDMLDSKIDFISHLWRSDIFDREHINTYYKSMIKNILDNKDSTLLSQIYGTKLFNDKIQKSLACCAMQSSVIESIRRYSGTAFLALDFESLSIREQEFLLDNVYIFSNLFGIIKAGDKIPHYKLKQNTKFNNLSLKEIYKPFVNHKNIFNQIDFIIDLRASVYQQIFPIDKEHVSFQFLKNGKVISHYSKLYRGRILRYIAKHHSRLTDIHAVISLLKENSELEYISTNKSTLYFEVKS